MARNQFSSAAQSQINAALDMLRECILKCPSKHWETPVGTWPFWMVAYHTLCFTDFYLAPKKSAWKPDKGTRLAPGLHPKGLQELWAERPSRKFERDELVRYVDVVKQKAVAALAAETAKSLKGSSGFHWITGPRTDTYFYNLRHLAHHTGQLTCFLWRIGVKTRWVREG